MAEWEEVRRLATDFQRIQASSTAHRLSERNCVELVSRLLDMGLVEVVHTLDGKEYGVTVILTSPFFGTPVQDILG